MAAAGVLASVTHNVSFDQTVRDVAVYPRLHLIATCAGASCFVWDSLTFRQLAQLGRLAGGVHSKSIRSCCFHPDGALLATSGDDLKTVVWDWRQRKALRRMAGHADLVTDCIFLDGGDTLCTASADGFVKCFAWSRGSSSKAAPQIASFFHPSGVCRVAFNPRSQVLLAASSDGSVAVWHWPTRRRMAVVQPHPDWMADCVPSLQGWMDPACGHSGGLVGVAVSPDGLHMATCSTDATCKLWDIVSYGRDPALVDKETAAAGVPAGAAPVSVSDMQLGLGTPQSSLGEAPIALGYHAHLLHTFRHESLCFDAAFTHDGALLLTCSFDATCRIWSVASGGLVFQINTPLEITRVSVSASDTVYLACESRILVIDLERLDALAGDDDLAVVDDWMALIRDDGAATQGQAEVAAMQRYQIQVGDAVQRAGHVDSLHVQRAIAHGTMAGPAFLRALARKHAPAGVNVERLFENLDFFKISPALVLRTIATAPVRPQDLLVELSAERPVCNELFALVIMGVSVLKVMERRGYEAVKTHQGGVLVLEGAEPSFVEVDRSKLGSRGYGSTTPRGSQRTGNRRGRIVRFKPSESLRIMADIRHNHPVPTPFLRHVFSQPEFPNLHPNQASEGDLDYLTPTPLVAKASVQATLVGQSALRGRRLPPVPAAQGAGDADAGPPGAGAGVIVGAPDPAAPPMLITSSLRPRRPRGEPQRPTPRPVRRGLVVDQDADATITLQTDTGIRDGGDDDDDSAASDSKSANGAASAPLFVRGLNVLFGRVSGTPPRPGRRPVGGRRRKDDKIEVRPVVFRVFADFQRQQRQDAQLRRRMGIEAAGDAQSQRAQTFFKQLYVAGVPYFV